MSKGETLTTPIAAAARALRQGGLCIYPTETFFALGCDARNSEAVARLLALKQRPKNQGLPCIIGGLEQLELACDVTPCSNFPEPLRDLVLRLMERFWPGPLSLVLPAAPGLAPGVPRQGEVALRLTPHPAARELCLRVESPLVASSANLRGEAPATMAKNLNRLVLDPIQALVDLPPKPAGRAPSTLARPLLDADGRAGVEMLRSGALEASLLEAAGCPILLEQSRLG